MASNVVSKEDCLKIINKVSKEQFQFVSFKVTPFGSEPLGFLADHSRLEIVIKKNNKQHVLNFFMKTVPCGIEAHKNYIERTGVFVKEALLYKDLFGKLQSLVENKFSPLCLLVNTNSHIVLEDLSVQGFTVIQDKSATFDFNHAKCAIEATARLHVSGIILEELNSTKDNPYRIYDHYKHMLFETTFSFEEGHPRNDWRITTMETLINLCKKMKKYNEEDCERSLRKLEEEMKTFLKPSKKYRNVLNHCDLWSNNIMFKYGENSVPQQCIIVDWQMLRYTPPCYDLLLCLYLTTTKNFQDMYFSKLVDAYYNTFTYELKKHHIDPNHILTKNEFLQSCIDYKSATLLEATMFGTIVYLNGDFSKDMLADNDTFDDFMLRDRSKLVCRLFDEDMVYRNRVESLLDQLLTCIL